MSLAQNSNAKRRKPLISRAGARSAFLALSGKVLAHSTDYRDDRVVLGFTRTFWFSIQGKPILYFKGLSFGYFSPNRYAACRVTG